MAHLVAEKHHYLYTRIATFEGFGGPVTADYSDPKHPATPTRPGRFTISSIGPHTTTQTGPDARVWSAVAWGTPLRLGTEKKLGKEEKQKVIQIKLPGKDWQRLTSLPAWKNLDKDQQRVVDRVINRNVMLWTPVLRAYTGSKQQAPTRLYQQIPDTWVFSDFGHVAVKYYRDVNHNGRQDHIKGEDTLSDFIHTTPDHELLDRLNAQASAGLSAPLTVSHGCVHALPTEVDEMIANGYLRVGGTFVVHAYTAPIKGVFEEVTAELRQKNEVHFYPKERTFVVYMVTKLS